MTYYETPEHKAAGRHGMDLDTYSVWAEQAERDEEALAEHFADQNHVEEADFFTPLQVDLNFLRRQEEQAGIERPFD